jgi:hypothetical protein
MRGELGKAIQELIQINSTGDDRQIEDAQLNVDSVLEREVKRLIDEYWDEIQSRLGPS